jgi:hypothetical protein
VAVFNDCCTRNPIDEAMQGWQIHATSHTTTPKDAKNTPKVMRKCNPTLLPRFCNVCVDMMDALRLCGETLSTAMLLRKMATGSSGGWVRSLIGYRCLWSASTLNEERLPDSKSKFLVTKSIDITRQLPTLLDFVGVGLCGLSNELFAAPHL